MEAVASQGSIPPLAKSESTQYTIMSADDTQVFLVL